MELGALSSKISLKNSQPVGQWAVVSEQWSVGQGSVVSEQWAENNRRLT